MANHYESVVIINAALEDEQIEQTVTNVLETVTSNGGEITDTEKWGRRRLAYPINKSKSGFYLVIRFTAPTELVAKLERVYRLDETIVRYLTVALDSKALEHIAKMKEKGDDTSVAVEVETDKEEEPKEETEKVEKTETTVAEPESEEKPESDEEVKSEDNEEK